MCSNQGPFVTWAVRRHIGTSTSTGLDHDTKTGDRASNLSRARTKTQTSGRFPPILRFKQVWQFYNALFGLQSQPSRSKWIRALSANITASSGARNTRYSSIWHGGDHLMAAQDFNALQASLQRIADNLTLKKMVQSASPVAESLVALKQWLLLYKATIDKIAPSAENCQLCYRNICKSLESSPIPQGNSWHDQRAVQQWLHVITGWSSSGIGRPGEHRAWSLQPRAKS